jgi:hypothetical protein
MMPGVEPSETLTAKLLGARQGGAEEVGSGPTDLLIQGLVDRLPKPNGTWSLEDRAKWLRAAASIFSVIYKTSGDEHREIGVVFVKQDAERIA